ncbi:MAG: AAA family ATPase [Acidimicrobiales bacterium]
MARPHLVHRCSSCGVIQARWAGRCSACGEWNSLVEQVEHRQSPGSDARLHRDSVGAGATAVTALTAVDPAGGTPCRTGIDELDRVLGGGLVPGSVTLVGGEPGVGKSTLLLQVLRSVALGGGSSLLVSGEESAQQVRVRAERLGPLPPGLFIVPGSDVSVLGAVLDERDYDLVVVDSIQAVSDPATTGIPGSMAQVRACSDILTALAKERGVAFVLVGHVTKDGSLAGPRVLEHLVDTVLSVEGDRHHALRLVRAVKHRFGSTGELGLFEMGEEGMAAVADPYALLLGDRRPGVPGGAVFPAIEGQRPLLVEIQALVSPSFLPQPRRSVQGIEAGRLAVLLGVLACRLGIITAQADVFASAVGGSRWASRRETWRSPWPLPLRSQAWRYRPTWCSSGKSASAVRSGRCPTPPAACRRLPGSASAVQWSRCLLRRFRA